MLLAEIPIEIWGVVGFAVLVLLIFVGIPIAIAMAVVGVVGGALLTGLRPTGLTFAATALEAVFPYGLSVVPMFILMDVFVTHAKLSGKLYDGMQSLLGHRPGGLAQATVVACALFGAVCGSSLATAATMTRVALPQMRVRNYDDGLATASIAAGGTLGILIPPSIILMIYGVLTGTSVGKLFLGGILPGIVGTLLYLLAVRYKVWRRPGSAPVVPKLDTREQFKRLIGIWDVIVLFGLVLGGIYGGWFSTTEAAAVGAFGGLLAAVVRTGGVRFLPSALEDAAKTTAMIFFIIVGTATFNAFIERTHLPNIVVSWVAGSDLSPLVVVVGLMTVYIVLGCIMDGLSIIFVTIPIVFPVIQSLGIDPVWFGILLVCATEIGLITPPVGMNLFVIRSLAKSVPITKVWTGVVPFVVADIFRLAILIGFPTITLYLPSSVR